MKAKHVYDCTSCGGRSLRWQGQCPACGEWNTLAAVTAQASAKGRSSAPTNAARLLHAVEDENLFAVSTGFAALDRVLGKGLVPGSAVLLGGEPGIGKSTLLLQLAGRQAELGRSAVYLSGEESLVQLKHRAGRLGLLGGGLMALASTSADDAVGILAQGEAPDLLIVDSVQTLASGRAEGLPGSVSQVRAVAAELVEQAKKSRSAVILVGHVTKDGQIAGPKLLEHMVDTVLSLEGDRREWYRVLRVLKNRFGPSDELVLFQMREEGMQVVEDPSTLFLDHRDPSLSGSALALAVEGNRPFAVEVQALVARSHLSIPRRASVGFDANRLHLLLAVLEKRLNLNLGQSDVFVKIGGGLAMRDPGLDLALAAAVLSSFYDRPLPESAAFWGELDLNGHIRPAPGHETRIKQAQRLGYGPLFYAGNGGREGCKTLGELQQALFGRK